MIIQSIYQKVCTKYQVLKIFNWTDFAKKEKIIWVHHLVASGQTNMNWILTYSLKLILNLLKKQAPLSDLFNSYFSCHFLHFLIIVSTAKGYFGLYLFHCFIIFILDWWWLIIDLSLVLVFIWMIICYLFPNCILAFLIFVF
jgi:hypothetical protein